MYRSHHFLSLFAITLLSLAIYANSLQNGFVYDDGDTIVNNILIKDLSNLSSLFGKEYFSLSGETSYRPVVTLTYFIDYALYGVGPWGYHLTNVLIHATNGLLLYIFMTLLIGHSEAKTYAKAPQSRPVSQFLNLPLIISLLFVTQPVLTEAVNAVSFREDLLASLFYISTLILYLITRSGTSRKPGFLSLAVYIFSCITYSLALFSKEMSLTLVAIVFCLEWLNRKDNGRARIVNWQIIGYTGITCGYIFVRFYYFLSPISEELPAWSFPERLQTIPWLLMNYIKLCLFPISLSTDYVVVPVKSAYSPLFIIPLIAIISLAGAALITKKAGRMPAFGGIFFFVSLTPVCNIVRITNPFAERYAYLPAIGLVIVTGWAIHHLLLSEEQNCTLRRLVLPTLAFFLIIGLYSMIAIERNAVWKDSYSLWSDTVRKMPNSSRAHYNCGFFYSQQGNIDKAIREYNVALKLKPDHHKAAQNLALLYFDNGLYSEASKVYEEILIMFPNDRFARGMQDEVLKKIAK